VSDTERVPLSDVRDLIAIGEALPFRVLDAQARLLLNEGHTVGSERQFDMLIERGAWVERPKVESVRLARAAAADPAARVVAQRQSTLFDLWDRALWDLDDLYRRLARGKASAQQIDTFADGLLQLIDRDVDVSLFLCVRQDDRRFALYASHHGLHCAVLGLLLARQLAWDSEAQATLLRSALTMNVAMADLQAHMAEQGEPPTAKQLELIRAHPQAAVRLLQQAGVGNESWLATVAQHHERDDGKGYPLGLQPVVEPARVLRTVDVFMAKISPRARRPPMTPQNAARQQFQQDGGQALGTALIRAIGVHPPGTQVQLKSGEIGVVSRRPPGSTAPLVATLTDARGVPATYTHQRNSSLPEYAVVAPLAELAGMPKILAERVYGMMLL
jgi:HD-GYP domain-containing protein (c-di-GMP phosphodiesterase class II)